METTELAPGILLFRGKRFDSNATALIRGRDVLLIDGMGSRDDAEELRRFLRESGDLHVRFILSTHYFSDHMAAFALFPEAEILAHRFARETFWSEEFRTPEEEAHFVEPSILISGGLTWKWGQWTLEIFHNPGHTMGTLNVFVPEADLLFASDTAVGNIAYFRYSTPELLSTALRRAQERGASRVVCSHGGVRPSSVLRNASTYIERLGPLVQSARLGAPGKNARAASEDRDLINAIPIEPCLAEGVEPTDFERIFHGRNLETVAARGLFSKPEAGRSLRANC